MVVVFGVAAEVEVVFALLRWAVVVAPIDSVLLDVPPRLLNQPRFEQRRLVTPDLMEAGVVLLNARRSVVWSRAIAALIRCMEPIRVATGLVTTFLRTSTGALIRTGGIPIAKMVSLVKDVQLARLM